MVDHIHSELLIPTLQIEWQRRAAHERLVAFALPPRDRERALVRLGSILIAAGCRLPAAGVRHSLRNLSAAPTPCAGVAL